MKKLLLVTAMMVMAAPLWAQDESIDVTNLLNGLGGGNNQGGRGRGNQPQIPDSKLLYADIENALKKGKTPLEKDQVKPLKSLIDSEIVTLTDQIQLMQQGYQNNNQNTQNNQPAGRGRGNPTGTNNQQNQQTQPSATAITVETVTSLKNQDFIDNKLAIFLTPEQAALIKKTAAEDKNNSTCLGGLLDRYYNQMQSNTNNNNRGNNTQNNQNNQNRGNNPNFTNNQNNQNNQNQTRPNGMKYCMAIEVTAAERLEPIRKVLAKGNMPLAKDKEVIAEITMKAELGELQDALRAALTQNNNSNNQGNNRGGNAQNNRNGNQQDPRQLIFKSRDNILKKVEAMLNPKQAETLKDWHYTEILATKGGIDALIAIEGLADTPLTEEQITKVTAAYPEFQRQIQDLAKQTNQNISQKQRDSAAMNKILDTFLEPAQIASYKLALKYGPETGSK